MDKYVISKLTQTVSDTININKWFAVCKKKEIPYIVINKGSKYSDIHWDGISYDSSFDKIFEENLNIISDRCNELYSKYSNSKSRKQIESMNIYFDRIRIEESIKIADELFDLIDSIASQKPKKLKNN